jgi:hypothetical protein
MASSEEWRREDEGPVGRPAFEDAEAETASSERRERCWRERC